MRMRPIRVGWLSVMAGVLWASAGLATAQEPTVRGGPGGRLPLDKVAEPFRGQVSQVLEQPTLVTHGKEEAFSCRPALYYWFAEHPDRAAAVWRRLGAQCMDITDRGGGRFGWTDRQGSEVHWDTVYAGPRMRIWYAEGRVRPALLLPLVPFRAVLVLHHAEGRDAAGHLLLRQQADLTLHTDSKTAALITRLIGPSAPKLAEQYIGQVQMFFAALPWYLEQHPEQSVTLLSGVLPPTAPEALPIRQCSAIETQPGKPGE